MSKKIPLTQGKYALVDDEDYEYLSQWKWHVHKNGQTCYAERNAQKGEKGWVNSYHCKIIRMHRVVLERKLRKKLKKNEYPDHINGDGLNNRRDNLRTVDHRTNMQNRHTKKTSEYPGVSFYKRIQKYQVHVSVREEHKGLGYFDTQEEAYKKYLEACEIINSGDKEAIKELMSPIPHSSKYKGVSWNKACQKWQGEFVFNKKQYYMGLFNSEYKAHIVVEKKRKEIQGGK